MRQLARWIAIVLVGLASASCDRLSEPRTARVVGRILVNRQPAAELAVLAHELRRLEQGQPPIATTCTARDGVFTLASDASEEGLPEGEYVLTFLWGQRHPATAAYRGPDKLQSRYADPRTTPIRLSVESGKPIDLGLIELSTE